MCCPVDGDVLSDIGFITVLSKRFQSLSTGMSSRTLDKVKACYEGFQSLSTGMSSRTLFTLEPHPNKFQSLSTGMSSRTFANLPPESVIVSVPVDGDVLSDIGVFGALSD